jgi:predicted nucleic acid-binding Zn finger protein
MIKSPLGLRWKRAQAIVNNNVPLGYTVSVEMDRNNILIGCTCTCPDFRKEMFGRGIPHLRGVRVCKHTLALALCVFIVLEEEYYS